MSRLGVWQCMRLTLRYCTWGGSSRGARAFRERHLPAFRSENPQLELLDLERPGRHPYLEALYRNGNVRAVGVKNTHEDEILRLAFLLRSAAGKKTTKLLKRHVLPKVRQPDGRCQTASPSVQGRWTADTHATA